MPIISVEIIKIIDEREMQKINKKKKTNKQRQKGATVTKARVKG